MPTCHRIMCKSIPGSPSHSFVTVQLQSCLNCFYTQAFILTKTCYNSTRRVHMRKFAITRYSSHFQGASHTFFTIFLYLIQTQIIISLFATYLVILWSICFQMILVLHDYNTICVQHLSAIYAMLPTSHHALSIDHFQGGTFLQ